MNTTVLVAELRKEAESIERAARLVTGLESLVSQSQLMRSAGRLRGIADGLEWSCEESQSCNGDADVVGKELPGMDVVPVGVPPDEAPGIGGLPSRPEPWA